MTDKVQKIREEVARIQAYTQSDVLKEVLDYIDKVQEEPVKIKKGCKYRCLSDMVNRDTGNISFIGDKIYLAPEDDTLVSEENGWLCDTSENASNFELVEEPVSEEWIEELRTKLDSLSKEDFKKVFDKYAVDFNEEPVSDKLEKVVEEIVDPTVLNAYGVKEIANRLRRTMIEPVGEELEEAAKKYGAKKHPMTTIGANESADDFKAGAQWQKQKDNNNANHALVEQIKTQQMCYEKGMADMKQQMMAKAVDGIARPYDNEIYCILDSFNLKNGDKVKVIVIKDD